MKKLNFLSISPVGYREISFSYRPRIKPVLFPYQSRIVLVSSSYRSPIVLAKIVFFYKCLSNKKLSKSFCHVRFLPTLVLQKQV